MRIDLKRSLECSLCRETALTLLNFQQEGEGSLAAQRALKAAFKVNPHIPKFILGNRRMPAELPRYIDFGDENEAIEYVAFAIAAWTQTPGAIAWLRAHSRA